MKKKQLFIPQINFAIIIVIVVIFQSCSHLKPVLSTLVFKNINVVDVRKGQILTNHTVIIEGNHITSVRPGNKAIIPIDALVVDAQGKYLIPGLWDMHTHIIDPDTPGDPNITLPLFVANGVTGIRDMGSSSLDSIIRIREEVRNGLRIGPRIITAGKLLDGSPVVFPPDAILIKTPEEGRHIVDSLFMLGIDFIKIYEMLDHDVFIAIADQARLHGLTIVGHLPLSVDLVESIRSRMKSFEHLRNFELSSSLYADSLLKERTAILAREAVRVDSSGLAFGWSLGYGSGAKVRAGIHSMQRPFARATFDSIRCEVLFDQIKKNNCWQVPTLIAIEQAVMRFDTIARIRSTLCYVPDTNRILWETGLKENGSVSKEKHLEMKQQGEWYFRIVRTMRNNHLGLLAGTDVSNPWIVPGFSLHEELRLLVYAGLTPLEALQSATINPARLLMATDSMGTVESGRLANLVLLDANPLADISNTNKIRAVILNGKYFDRSALDKLLTDVKHSARAFGELRIK